MQRIRAVLRKGVYIADAVISALDDDRAVCLEYVKIAVAEDIARGGKHGTVSPRSCRIYTLAVHIQHKRYRQSRYGQTVIGCHRFKDPGGLQTLHMCLQSIERYRIIDQSRIRCCFQRFGAQTDVFVMRNLPLTQHLPSLRQCPVGVEDKIPYNAVDLCLTEHPEAVGGVAGQNIRIEIQILRCHAVGQDRDVMQIIRLVFRIFGVDRGGTRCVPTAGDIDSSHGGICDNRRQNGFLRRNLGIPLNFQNRGHTVLGDEDAFLPEEARQIGADVKRKQNLCHIL